MVSSSIIECSILFAFVLSRTGLQIVVDQISCLCADGAGHFPPAFFDFCFERIPVLIMIEGTRNDKGDALEVRSLFLRLVQADYFDDVVYDLLFRRIAKVGDKGACHDITDAVDVNQFFLVKVTIFSHFLWQALAIRRAFATPIPEYPARITAVPA